MPESGIKFYPVIARILLILGEHTVVTFRAAIISRTSGDLKVVDHRMLNRFLLEYKGLSNSCSEEKVYTDLYRQKAIDYLERKAVKNRRYGSQVLQPVIEIEIDLRGVTPKLLTLP